MLYLKKVLIKLRKQKLIIMRINLGQVEQYPLKESKVPATRDIQNVNATMQHAKKNSFYDSNHAFGQTERMNERLQNKGLPLCHMDLVESLM